MSKIVDRIGEIIASKGLSVKAFEQSISASNGAIGRAVNKGSDIVASWLSKIIEIYPDVNAKWLLTGEGEMLHTDIDTQTQVATAEPTAVDGIPLIPIEAMAGVLSGNSTQILEQECEHYNIPMFNGAEFLIRISGDSMQPKYYSGDIVACKCLPLDTFFQWNRVYVVDSEQGVIIKRVRRGCDDHHIVFVSDNTAYEPFELPLEKIYSIALVVDVVRAE